MSDKCRCCSAVISDPVVGNDCNICKQLCCNKCSIFIINVGRCCEMCYDSIWNIRNWYSPFDEKNGIQPSER